jgi:uncharacterized cupin superfamily protein
MSGYTIKNLGEVEDSAPKFGIENVQARFAAGDLGLQQLGLSFQRLAPDTRHPFGHRHTEQEEVYVVVEGGGRIKLDDAVEEVRQWDAVRVAPGVTRAFEAGPDGIGVLAIGAHALAPEDRGDVIADWWSEHET